MALATSVASAADRTISADYTLTANETVDGVLTVESGATVDLNGHRLTVQGLAGDGTITCYQNFVLSDLTSPDTTETHVTWVTKFGTVDAVPQGVLRDGTTTPTTPRNLFNDVTASVKNNDSTRILVMQSKLPLAITYDFGEGKAEKVNKYKIDFARVRLEKDNLGRGPKEWTLEGSSDNSEWTILDSQNNVTWSGANQTSPKEFQFSNDTAYRYYRITFKKSSDSTWLELHQLEYFDTTAMPELHVSVPDGAAATNSTVAIAGSVKVVKDGEGEFAEAKVSQTYTGGTVLAEGTYALAGMATLDWSKFTLGTDPLKPVALRVGENATLSNILDSVIQDSMIVGSNINVTVYKDGSDWSINGTLFLNYEGDSTNVFNHNGGSISVGRLALPREGSGEFNMNGGSVSVGERGTVFGSLWVGDHAILNLEGGVFATPFLCYHNGARGKIATVRFNGGTLKITGSGAMATGDHGSDLDYGDIENLKEVLLFRVAAGGGTIDTDGKDVTMPLAISEDPESTGGGLTFTGGGSIALNASSTYTGTTTVSGGTTLSVPGGTSVTFAGPIAFEADSTLNLASCTPGVVPLSASVLTLPAEGTVALTLNGGVFTRGAYVICSASDLTAADGAKFAPSTGDETSSWKVVGGTLVLTVGTVADNYWTGFAGDGKMSTPGNWAGGTAPKDGEDVDFSSVTATTTIDADIADVTFGAVTMGSGAVVFTNDYMRATSFSDMSMVAVAANSTVTLDGDLVFGTNVDSYVCRHISEGGKFVVTGKIIATSDQTGDLYPHGHNTAPGSISAKGLVNNAPGGKFYLVQAEANAKANWLIGEDGISGSDRYIVGDQSDVGATIKATADFTVSADIVQKRNLTLVPDGHEITLGTNVAVHAGGILGGGFSGYGLTTVTGAGKVVVNYNVTNLTSNADSRKNAFTVANGGTLAIAPGANTSVGTTDNGKLTVANATLEVAESGTVTLGSNLTLAEGATLGFNFTTRDEPVLDLTGKTVSFDEGETTNIVVKISAAEGKRPKIGLNVLTSGGKFADATVSLAEDVPGWAKGVSVVDGEIVLDVKPAGTMIIVR